MAFRKRILKCDLSKSPIMKIKELGYLVNLTEIEKHLNLRYQVFKPCFEHNRSTNICMNIDKIEQFVEERLTYKSNISPIEFLQSLGSFLNLTESERQMGIKNQTLKNIFSGKTKDNLEVQEIISKFVEEKF